jgi:hypothetical protein
MNLIDESIKEIKSSIEYHKRHLAKSEHDLKVFLEHKQLAELMTEPKEPVGQQ